MKNRRKVCQTLWSSLSLFLLLAELTTCLKHHHHHHHHGKALLLQQRLRTTSLPSLLSMASPSSTVSDDDDFDSDYSSSIFQTERDDVRKEEKRFQRTGIQREIDWTPASNPVSLTSEINLLQSGVLVRRGEFCHLQNVRLEEVAEECHQQKMTVTQGLLIRRQLMVSKAMRTSWKLKDAKKLSIITEKFQRRQHSLLEISYDFDLPPVSIIRAIVAARVEQAYPGYLDRDKKYIVRSIISGKSPENVETFLPLWELDQLQVAKKYDIVGYSEQTETPILWEEALCAFLDEHKVNYAAEETLREAQMDTTPDCLILDDCYINGQKVGWIDAKSFYASGLKENKHFSKKLKKQVHKYETKFGETGAVIFKHGFCRELSGQHPTTLFLDRGPLLVELDDIVREL